MRERAPTAATPARRAITLADFCRERSICLRFGWMLVGEGKLQVGRIGRRVVVYAEQAEEFDKAAKAGRL